MIKRQFWAIFVQNVQLFFDAQISENLVPIGRHNIFKRGYMSDLEMIFENTASECINIRKIV